MTRPPSHLTMLLSRHTRRRDLLVLGAGTAAWSFRAHAQTPDRMRRIGVLMTAVADDPVAQVRLAAFQQELQQFGWSDPANVRLDIRRHSGDSVTIRNQAAELVALAPDDILDWRS